MYILDKYKEAFLHLPDEIYAAQAEAETEAELSVILQNGVHNGSSASDVTSLFVRTEGEKSGFAYTQNLEEDPKEVLARAHESSLYTESAGLPVSGITDDSYTEKEPECEPSDIRTLWAKAELLDQWFTKNAPQLTLREISLTDRIRTIALVNSRGRDCCTSSHSFCFSVFAADERYPGRFFISEITMPDLLDFTADLYKEKLDRWYWQINAVTNSAENQESAKSFCPGNYRCVLDGSVMNNIFLTGWRMFTADNYTKHTTPFAGKLHTPIGNPVLNMTDRITRSGSGYSFRADCEGNSGRDVVLVKNGILTGFMNGLELPAADGHANESAAYDSTDNTGAANTCDSTGNAAASDIYRSTGNAGRKNMISGNIHTETLTIPKNFGIEPGASTFQELIEKLGDGIYIYESFDMFHSVNTVSGECSIPCSGILIRNGKPSGCIEGLTINGKVQDILKEITQIDREVQVQPMLMLNSFTVSSPDVLVNHLNVSK